MYSNKETKESECQQLGASLQIFEPPTSVDGVGNIFNNLELQVLSMERYGSMEVWKDGFILSHLNFDPVPM